MITSDISEFEYPTFKIERDCRLKSLTYIYRPLNVTDENNSLTWYDRNGIQVVNIEPGYYSSREDVIKQMSEQLTITTACAHFSTNSIDGNCTCYISNGVVMNLEPSTTISVSISSIDSITPIVNGSPTNDSTIEISIADLTAYLNGVVTEMTNVVLQEEMEFVKPIEENIAKSSRVMISGSGTLKSIEIRSDEIYGLLTFTDEISVNCTFEYIEFESDVSSDISLSEVPRLLFPLRPMKSPLWDQLGIESYSEQGQLYSSFTVLCNETLMVDNGITIRYSLTKNSTSNPSTILFSFKPSVGIGEQETVPIEGVVVSSGSYITLNGNLFNHSIENGAYWLSVEYTR